MAKAPRAAAGERGVCEEALFVPGGKDPRDAQLAETIQSEKTVFSGLIFDVNRIDVALANGHEAQRDVVRHPGAVAVVAITDDAKICLVRQYRVALDRVTVEIPAGKLDPGEDPLSAAQRELLEETGLVARSMAHLATIATSVGFSDELIAIYMATGLTFGPSHPDDDELLGVELVDVSEFVDAVLDGQVEDAKTVVGALALDACSRRLAPAPCAAQEPSQEKTQVEPHIKTLAARTGAGGKALTQAFDQPDAHAPNQTPDPRG